MITSALISRISLKLLESLSGHGRDILTFWNWISSTYKSKVFLVSWIRLRTCFSLLLLIFKTSFYKSLKNKTELTWTFLTSLLYIHVFTYLYYVEENYTQLCLLELCIYLIFCLWESKIVQVYKWRFKICINEISTQSCIW